MEENKESKFNFSEEKKNTTPETESNSRQNIKQEANSLWKSIKDFLEELLDFRQDTDRDATIEAIKNDIPFKGATAWILICSVFVASVGLNANSTAVVIGAMLISPLMGPILGIGLSIAINDIDTLRSSLVNLATMIVLSLLTAFLFFWLFPSHDTSELLGRTAPDVRDVLIAFFGGLALIIARTKKGTIASVIFGVAIATALMPPLCTVGYGLAKAVSEDVTKGLHFARGAMYLFTINTIFIALATFLVLKLLRFPMIKYANSKKRKRIARIASFVAILTMLPAIWTFVDVFKKNQFDSDATKFIEKELAALPNAKYIEKNATKNYDPENGSVIELTTFGDDEIPATTQAVLRQRMQTYDALSNTNLVVNQANRFKGMSDLEYMKELRARDSLDLMSQKDKITYLEDKVSKLSKFERNAIDFNTVAQEVKFNYEDVEEFAYANEIKSDYASIDTVSVFTVRWNTKTTTEKERKANNGKLQRWLQYKLHLDSLVVKEYK